MNLPFFSGWFWYEGFFIHSNGDLAGWGRLEGGDNDEGERPAWLDIKPEVPCKSGSLLPPR